MRLQKHFINLYLQRHKLGPNKNAFNLQGQFGPAGLVMKIKWINDLVLCSKRGCNVIAKLWHLGIKNGWSFFQDFSISIFFVVKGIQIHIFVSHAFQKFFTVFYDLFRFFTNSLSSLPSPSFPHRHTGSVNHQLSFFKVWFFFDNPSKNKQRVLMINGPGSLP